MNKFIMTIAALLLSAAASADMFSVSGDAQMSGSYESEDARIRACAPFSEDAAVINITRAADAQACESARALSGQCLGGPFPDYVYRGDGICHVTVHNKSSLF